MESVIDIEALAAPISEDSPCGSDPREAGGFDSSYHRLKNAREVAMASERPDTSAQPEDDHRSHTIDIESWSVVVEEASNILCGEGKDLEACALLTEGLARLHGPAGVRDGFFVTARIAKNYWDGLFPGLNPDDEDSLDDRLASISGLNGVGQPGPLAIYIAKTPITNTGFEDFYNHDYERAWKANSVPDPERREEQLDRLGFTLDDIEKASRETPTEFYIHLNESVKGALEALREMDEVFIEVCGHEAPPTSMMSEALTKLAEVIKYLAGDRLSPQDPAESDSVAKTAAVQQNAHISASDSKVATGAIASREDAIARLRMVATYFRATEPHSPLSYSLQNVIRWAQLPLDKLIDEWIADEDARERYKLMTGIRTSASSFSESDGNSDDED